MKRAPTPPAAKPATRPRTSTRPSLATNLPTHTPKTAPSSRSRPSPGFCDVTLRAALKVAGQIWWRWLVVITPVLVVAAASFFALVGAQLAVVSALFDSATGSASTVVTPSAVTLLPTAGLLILVCATFNFCLYYSAALSGSAAAGSCSIAGAASTALRATGAMLAFQVPLVLVNTLGASLGATLMLVLGLAALLVSIPAGFVFVALIGLSARSAA